MDDLKGVECNLSFKFSVVLRSHHQLSHKADMIGMSLVECYFCDKTFSSTMSRNFHNSQVHEGRQLVPNVANKLCGIS